MLTKTQVISGVVGGLGAALCYGLAAVLLTKGDKQDENGDLKQTMNILSP